MANTNRNSIVFLSLVSFSSFILLPSPAAAICIPRKSPFDDHGAPSLSTPSPTQAPATPAPTIAPPLMSSLSSSGSGSGSSFISGSFSILDRVCGSTDYKLLCMSTLAPVLREKANSRGLTVKSILEVAIKVAVVETKLAMTVIDGLVNRTANEDAKSALGDCNDFYNDALDNFQAASDAMGDWDLGTINSMLSACITSFSDCDDELTGIVTDFAGHGEKLTHMTSNCLAIASVVN